MKEFYVIRTEDTYSLVSYISSKANYQVLIESLFAFDIGIHDLLISVNSDNSSNFNKIMTEGSFDFEYTDLKEAYKAWIKKRYPMASKLDEDFFEQNNIYKITSVNIPLTSIGFEGLQVLLEHQIDKMENFVLYVHSDELSHHHIPHAHLQISKEKKNYCSISLADFSVLEPEGLNDAYTKIGIQLAKNNIQKAREYWNTKTNSPIRFLKVGNTYTNNYSGPKKTK